MKKEEMEGRREIVRTMYAEDKSYTVIGAALGISRNAVAGIVNRIGNMPKRRLGAKPGLQAKSKKRLKRLGCNDWRIVTETIKDLKNTSEIDVGIGILDLRRSSCRFPAGMDSDGLMTYCGCLVRSESSWCPEHYNRVFSKQKIV